MNALATVDLARLAKICGLFSSNHAGERAAAAHKADQLIRDAGLQWADILRPAIAPQSTWQAPPQGLTPSEILARHGRALTAWEKQFLATLVRQRGRCSARQAEIFEQIRRKVAGATR